MLSLRAHEIPKVPDDLRSAYLDSLLEPQELFIENLVQSGRSFLLLSEGETLGYAVINHDTLVEFFMTAGALANIAFGFTLDNFKITRALCKTFDPLMLAHASSKSANVKTTAFLFRGLSQLTLDRPISLDSRVGRINDLDRILAIHDGFFDSAEEVQSYIKDSGLFLYETDHEVLIGCGIIKRIIPQRHDFDIGMVVAPTHRRQNFGSAIIADLARHCLRSGYRPICGCRVDNLASRRTLEKAGFVTQHSLLEFSF